ncbi:MAG TPA: serpin family protein [Candidatus Coprenecus pullistercoris]|nr:serpin family protein [Candidatus Coprenecus pullistercoris]
MKKSLFSIMLVPVMAVASCGTPVPSAPGSLTSHSQSFAYRLFDDVVSNDSSDLVFISPLSASMALSLTAAGANGTTQQAMLDALGFDSASVKELNEYNRSVLDYLNNDTSVVLNAANSIWASDDFVLNTGFCKDASVYYDAKVANLDFSDPASSSIINQWCSENTAGRIDKIIDGIDPNIRMYLLNAIYFKGLWAVPFNPDFSEEGIFHGDRADTQVKFMHQTGHSFPCYFGSEVSMLELPYGDGTFVMDIYLPAEGLSVDEVAARLDEFSTVADSLHTPDRLRVTLPAFKAEYDISLNSALQRLGMGEAFTASADFSGMSKEPLMIGEVKQKAFIEVNEEGSEAAAVTSVAVMRASLNPEPVRFTVDRPFVFLIRERISGTVLFMGLVRNL